jgi:hypothetical protein
MANLIKEGGTKPIRLLKLDWLKYASFYKTNYPNYSSGKRKESLEQMKLVYLSQEKN